MLLDEWVRRKFKKDQSDYPKEITVRRLLSHRAGLSVDSVGTIGYGAYTDMRNILMGDVTAGRAGTKSIHPPETRYDNSRGGNTVAEAILEAHKGRSVSEFLNNEILKLYSMTRSTFN